MLNGANSMWEFIERIVRSVLGGILRFFKVIPTEEQWDKIMQFVKFGIVGLSNTLLAYCLNVLVLLILRPAEVAWDFVAANIVAFVLSVLWSYYWNNKYVFTLKEGQSRSGWKTLLKTYVSYGFTGIILNNVLSWLWINVFGISKFIAPLINLIISVPVNFVINKMWAFKEE